jgi:DNA-binding MarR family transcriptional regulator
MVVRDDVAMPPAHATLSEQLEQSVTRLAHVLIRGSQPGLSRTAASVLHRLASAGPQRITELAAYESIAQPSATALVGRLEAQGLVDRAADPSDRRAVLVSVTAAGQRLLAERRAARAEALGARLAALDAAERDTLAAAVPLLARLADAPV